MSAVCSIVTATKLALEGGADALFIVIESPTEAVASPKTLAAGGVDVLLESVATCVGDGAHAGDSILEASTQAGTALSNALGSDHAGADIRILRGGNTLSSNATGCASAPPVTGTSSRDSRQAGPRTHVEAAEHLRVGPVERSSAKARAVDRRDIVRGI